MTAATIFLLMWLAWVGFWGCLAKMAGGWHDRTLAWGLLGPFGIIGALVARHFQMAADRRRFERRQRRRSFRQRKTFR